MEKYDDFKVCDGIWVIPDFAQSVLGVDPSGVFSSLRESIPVRYDGDEIVPNTEQWVDGSHPSLKYRGHALKRAKIWYQKRAPGDPYRVYSYTGWQHSILPATSPVEKSILMQPVASRYDEWAVSIGAMPANHYIVTAYNDGGDSIGYHSDKMRSLEPQSMITVVKIGDCARPFQIRPLPSSDKKSPAPFFSRPLEPGTAVVMTLAANATSQHGVPTVDGLRAASGSIVFRTARQTVTEDNAGRNINRSIVAKAKRDAARDAKRDAKRSAAAMEDQ